MIHHTQKEDIFVIPKDDGRYYLYTPLRQNVAIVNDATVDIIARYLEDETLDVSEEKIVETLKTAGLLGERQPKPPTFPENYDFCPHEVTLFLTSRCNLRCRYCYADAGIKSVEMSWDIAKEAIDFVAKNAGILGSPKFGVGFHGGGEPTVAWDMLVKCVDYAHEKANQMGLEADIFAATNGLLSQKQREYIANKFTTLNISLDGPADIQNTNRPKVDGSGSYEEIKESLEYFDRVGFHYGIRSTITASVVHRMEEIVETLKNDFHIAYLHMEPSWFCGRCIINSEAPPHDEDFIRNFVKASRKAKKLGVDIFYSGARLNILTSKFCAAPGDGFTVLPEGIVTSCYEITEKNDARSSIFHYGKYNMEQKCFEFDEKKLSELRKLSVENIPYCQDCFCKWHCAGDCLAKVFEKSGTKKHEGSIRCKLNRELTLISLDELVGKSEDM